MKDNCFWPEDAHLEDSEARYLVNQFNKLASWQHNRIAIVIASFSALLVFRSEILISMTSFMGKEISYAILVVVVYALLDRVGRYVAFLRDQREKILSLEEYRSIHKGCLPDILTLNNLWHSHSDKDLRKNILNLPEKRPRTVWPSTRVFNRIAKIMDWL